MQGEEIMRVSRSSYPLALSAGLLAVVLLGSGAALGGAGSGCIVPVPEPMSLSLLLTGVGALGLVRHLKAKRAKQKR
jgi:hypothetical protein